MSAIQANDPWLLRVLGAFQHAMNSGKPDNVPAAQITWPDKSLSEGRYTPFVWFEVDNPQYDDGRETHLETIIVTGVLMRKDPSDTATVLMQAIRAYYAMRARLGTDIEDQQSVFNAFFEGVAEPAGGVRPADTDSMREIYGQCAIVERWAVTGSAANVGAANA